MSSGAISIAWAYRLMWLAIIAFFAVAMLTSCARVDLSRSVNVLNKALRAGAIGVEQADGVIEGATDIQIARCRDRATEKARTDCMGKLSADHQARISDLLIQLARFYDEAAKSLPKLEALIADLERYLDAAGEVRK